MRISDWSSYVCASDLASVAFELGAGNAVGLLRMRQVGVVPVLAIPEVVGAEVIGVRPVQPLRLVRPAIVFITVVHANQHHHQIGRAACRGSVCQYVYSSMAGVS